MLFSCQGSGAKASYKTCEIVSLESVPVIAKGVSRLTLSLSRVVISFFLWRRSRHLITGV